MFTATINWDEVIALTTLSTVATSALGVGFSFYIRTIISNDVEAKLKAHTETVLGPLVKQLEGVRNEQIKVALELARSDERFKQHERVLQCGNFKLAHNPSGE